MLIRFRILILLAALGVNSSFAQRYPTLKHVEVRARVTYDSPTKFFYYDYSLTNDAKNAGTIIEFGVDISRGPNSVLYDSIGLQFAGIGFMESDYRSSYPVLGARVLPVGFLSLPPGWISFWGNMPEASVMKDRAFIAPGQSVSGIVLMSKGLPGIRNCVARPDFEVDRYFPDMDSPAADSLDADQMDSIMDACNYYGPTVGPWAPDANFLPIVFLDTLSSFIGQARTFNWIHSDKPAEKYLGYLDETRILLLSNKKSEANDILRTILRDADVDSSSVITDEAYGLIRYNTEYLADKLK